MLWGLFTLCGAIFGLPGEQCAEGHIAGACHGSHVVHLSSKLTTSMWILVTSWISVFPRGQLPWNQHPCGQESVGFAAAMVTYLSGATFQIHLMKGVIGHKFINKSSASTSTITQLRREPLQKHLCSTVPLLPWPKDWILLITHCWIERIAGLA